MKILKQYGGFIALFFGVVAIIMLFISPALRVPDGFFSGDIKVTGFEAIFGAKRKILGVETTILEFNTLGFLALFFLIGGLVVPLVPLPANFKYLIGALLLLISGIFFFVFPGTHDSGIAANTPIIIASIFTLIGFAINAVLGFLNFKR